MPAQGHAIEKVVVPSGPETVKLGIVPLERLCVSLRIVLYPIKLKTIEAKAAVVGTKNWNSVNCPKGYTSSIMYMTPTITMKKVGIE